jgi:hypothetical protein
MHAELQLGEDVAFSRGGCVRPYLLLLLQVQSAFETKIPLDLHYLLSLGKEVLTNSITLDFTERWK